MVTPQIHIEIKIAAASSLEDGAVTLSKLLSGGFSVGDDGSLYSVRQLVARVHGLKIKVFAREHSPPHFHLSGGGVDATFSLSDCTHLEGKICGREKELVKWWYARNRPMLVKTWNETRPADCPVGPIET